jgi:Tol biopolymer transport system component
MKTLTLTIIVVIAVSSTMFFFISTNWFYAGQSGHILKLADLYRIRAIYNPNDTGSDLGVNVGGFDWSKDGKLAVFAFCNANPDGCTLWKITFDGKDIQEIKMPQRFDGIRKIRIVSSDVIFDGLYNGQNNQDVFRYDLENHTLEKLTDSGKVNIYDMMPDGNLVYQEDHYYPTKICPLKANDTSGDNWAGYYTVLWIADQHGNKIKSIYNGTELFQELDASSDGNSLAFTDMTHPLNPKLHSMISCNFVGPPLDGISTSLKLLDVNSGKITTLETSTTERYQNLLWSHDGNSILYTVPTNQCIPFDKTGNSQTCSAGFVKLVNVHDGTIKLIYGKELAPYTEIPSGIAVSNDGKSMIFGINEDVNDGLVNGKGIYIFESDNPIY